MRGKGNSFIYRKLLNASVSPHCGEAPASDKGEHALTISSQRLCLLLTSGLPRIISERVLDPNPFGRVLSSQSGQRISVACGVSGLAYSQLASSQSQAPSPPIREIQWSWFQTNCETY